MIFSIEDILACPGTDSGQLNIYFYNRLCYSTTLHVCCGCFFLCLYDVTMKWTINFPFSASFIF